LREEGLRRGLCAVRSLAEVDRVEIELEDLFLALALLQLAREERLTELASERDVGALVEQDGVADVLLGDGRRALFGRAGQDVDDRGAGDAVQVDTVVAVEPLVLDRDDGVDEVGGDGGDGYDGAVLEVEPGEEHAVGRVDTRGLRDLEGVFGLVVRQVVKPGAQDTVRAGGPDDERRAQATNASQLRCRARSEIRPAACDGRARASLTYSLPTSSLALSHLARVSCQVEPDVLPNRQTGPMQNSSQPRVPELLAPAGGREALRAAVNNGADAVYLGVDRLNARRGAENFTLDTLGEATRYAHLRGAKVYLTANVVIRPSEMADALDLVDEAWALGVDAVIVQDLGLARAVASTSRTCGCTRPLRSTRTTRRPCRARPPRFLSRHARP
jgi:hypothetical protein